MKKTNIFLFVIIIISTQLFSQQRNVRPIRVKTSTGKSIELYKASYALLIGVSQYTAGWPKLLSVPGELIKVEDALQSNGFIVSKIMDPDDEELEDAFKDFIDRYGYDETNRLLFFYSGHGYSMDNGSRGYLVPTNAPDPRKDHKGFLRRALSMSQILTWCRDMRSKHALFLFDSCFSGTIFKAKALPAFPPHITDLISRPVRQFITAGDAGEEFPARSVFTPSFVKALRGEADLTKDGYVTGTELGIYLHDKVIYYESGQTPQYGKIKDPDLDEGDFVFIVPKPIEPVAPVQLPIVDPETEKRSKTTEPVRKSAYTPALRNTPISMGMSVDNVKAMLKEKNLFDSDWNNTGNGFYNDFVLQKNGQVVYDRNSGLMWQQSGSDNFMTYENAKAWVEQLNFAGYSDWRLPTLEEAMSLMESKKNSDGLYIDSKFDKTQQWIWTSDLVKGESWAWVVGFNFGYCTNYGFYANYYVRAVRSG